MGSNALHSFILVLAIAFAFLFAKSPFAQYDLQLAAGLFIGLFIVKRFVKSSGVIEAIIFTLIVFVIVNSTGGLNSPFFFLTYFLLFALALQMEPAESMVATLAAILFFLIDFPQKSSLESMIPLLSLGLLTPFAMFMGQQYLKNIKLKKKNEDLEEDTFLFLSLSLKTQLQRIKRAVENFIGQEELGEIKRASKEMERMIEKFEKNA